GNSLFSNQQLITKVYFSRLTVPVSAALVGMVDFVVAVGVLALMMLWFRIVPGWSLLALPAFTLLAVVAALAVGPRLSALSAGSRDVRAVIPFLPQIWMYASPVAYPASKIPPQWRLLYDLNPMAGVIGGFRWALLGQADGLGWSLAISAAAV